MANDASEPLPPFDYLWLRGREYFFKHLRKHVFSKEENRFLLQDKDLVRQSRTVSSMGDAAGKKQYRELYDLIRNHLESKDADDKNSFEKIPDLAQLAKGEIHIGDVYCRTGRKFGLSSHPVRVAMDTPFRGGIGIFGQPGSGKTWTWGKMEVQLIPALRLRDGTCTSYIFEGDKATVVDFIYTPLLKAGVESQVITSVAINPLQVPDRVSAQMHAKTVTAMCAEAFWLEQASKIMLHKAILRLYQETRVLDSQREYFPDLADLRAVIEKDTSSGAARNNLLGKLDELFLTFGDAVRYSRGYSCEDFEGHSVILPLAEYEAAHQALIIQHFVCGSYERKITLNDRRPLVASIEEAGSLVEYRSGISHERPLFRLCRVGREYKLGFIFLHQHAAKVDPSLISLLHLTLLGNSNGEDLAQGVKALGCSDAHARWTREHIEDFQWVATSPAIGGQRTPVLIGSLPFETAPAPPRDQIPNDVLKKIRLVRSEDARVLTVQAYEPAASPTGLPAAAPNIIVPPLSREELGCLIACAHPDRAYKQICQVAGIGPVQGSKVLQSLEQRGFIHGSVVKIGYKSWYKIAAILDAGLKLLPPEARALRDSILATTERGLDVHNHKIRRIAASYSLITGVRVRIEAKYTLDGRVVAVDVVVERDDGQAEGIEVEQTTDGRSSASKLLALPFTQRQLIAEGADALVKLRNNIKPIDTEGKITVTTLAGLGFEPLPVFNETGILIG